MTEPRRIPRIVWQTCRDKDDLPDRVREARSSLMADNPQWRFELFDDADRDRFVETTYPQRILRAYRSIDPAYGAARADYWRYLVIYRHGGVYLDIKATATRPLDEIVHPDDRMLLSQWQNGPGQKYQGWGMKLPFVHPGGEYQNFFVIAEPGHPLLARVIRHITRRLEEYVHRLDEVGHFGVLRTTGPHAMTQALIPALARHPHRIFDSEAEGLIASIYFPEPHQSMFVGGAAHYSKLTIPVVRPPHGLAVQLLRRLRNRLLPLSDAPLH